jgi:hypothetical protein
MTQLRNLQVAILGAAALMLAPGALAQVQGKPAGADEPAPQQETQGARYDWDDDDRYGRDWDDDDRYETQRRRYDYGRGTVRRIGCESRNGRYRRCDVGGRIEGIRFDDRYSRSRCQLGRDWGVEPRAVWVDNGCRATFEVRLAGGGGYYGDDPYGGRSDYSYISCESENRRYRECRIRERFYDIRIADRRSDQPCVEGRDWGTTRNGVWVNNGCRATFAYRTDARRYGRDSGGIDRALDGGTAPVGLVKQ